MQVASASTTVEVTAESVPLLTTETASTGTVMSHKQITELPLPYGNPFTLAGLAAGVTFTGSDQTTMRPYDNSVTANIRTDGLPGGNEFTLDGAPNTATSRGTEKGLTVAYVPPADAVNEFKMETASFDAAQGHAPGATVNVSLKSGTNALHGSVYGFTEPKDLKANDYFLKRAGQTPSANRYNRMGGVIGGPVVLPKVYDGRNKTFFFFAYENLVTDAAGSSQQTVPTAAERTGDFSALLAQGITIYDPLTARSVSGKITRTAFAGNIIPANRISPIALNILKYIPMPNQAGDALGDNNYLANVPTSNRFNSEIVRLDHVISDKQRIFVRMNRNLRDTSLTPGWAGTVNGIRPVASPQLRGNQGFIFDDVYSLSSQDVLAFRLGVTRYYDGRQQVADGFDPASLGFPASTVALFGGATYFPKFSFGTFSSIGYTAGNFTADNTIFMEPSYTKIIGKHVLHAGWNLRLYRENAIPTSSPIGSYSFSTNYTRKDSTSGTAAPIGQDLAALLLGMPTGGSTDNPSSAASSANQTVYNAVYLQDDFKVTRKLTLNMGLRYELEGATTDRYNRNIRGFDTTSSNPVEPAAIAAYTRTPDPLGLPASQFHVPGGLLFANSNERGFWNGGKGVIQPRIGGAYQLTPKTVLRAGWGLYMIPFGVDGQNQQGFSQQTQLVPTLDNGLTFVASLANPYPNGLLSPSGSTLGLATFLGQSISVVPLDRKMATAQRWQVGLQRELPGKWLVEATFAMTRGLDMAVSTNLNAIPRQYLSTSPVYDSATDSFLTAKVTNPFNGQMPGSLGGTTVNRSQLLLPFPEFGSVNSERYDGGTHYQGLEIRAQRRSRGFTFNGAYTRSRLHERLTMLNDTDASPEDRVATDDRPNRFTFNNVFEVPFGKGRKWGSGWSRLLDGIAGGWQISGVYYVQSGRPMTLGNRYFTGDPNGLTASWSAAAITTPAFDTSGFYLHDAAVQTNGADDPAKQRSDSRIKLASNIRTLPTVFPNFRSDRINNLDLSLGKTFVITEKVKLQFIGSLLNVTNHVQFDPPSLDPTKPSFGLVTSQTNPTRTGQFGAKLLF
jgi:hypothetical protein